MAKTNCCRIQLDQIAFVIRQQPEALKTLNELGTPPASIGARTRGKHNVSCVIRQCFGYESIIVFSRRIKPNSHFKARCGLTFHREVTGRPHDDSVSSIFNELVLNLSRVRTDDQKSVMRELSRDYAREFGVGGMGR
jgi:hypothetical protein